MTIQEKLYRNPLFVLNRGNLTCRTPVQTRCFKGLFTAYVCDDRPEEESRQTD